MAKSKASFGKREKEMKRLKERQEKQEKMQERKAGNKTAKSLNDMMAYIDENGNLSSVPPDPSKKRIINAEDVQIGVPKYEHTEEELTRTGVVAFFNDSKGFGFINEANTGERFFVHISQLTEPIAERDRVTFEIERGDRGLNAVNVKKIS
jgi:cold shock CspA family protein